MACAGLLRWIMLLGGLTLAGAQAVAQAQPDPMQDPSPYDPAQPTPSGGGSDPSAPPPDPGNAPPPSGGMPILLFHQDEEVLGPGQTAMGTSLTFRNARQWRLLELQSRLMRGDGRVQPTGAYGFVLRADRSRPPSFLAEGDRSASMLRITPTAGGAAGEGWSLWATFDYSRLKDARATFRKKGHAEGITAGLEYAMSERLTLGMSVGYVHTSLDTSFNGGRSRIWGITVTPYASLALTDWLNVTVNGGYVYNHERFSWQTAAGVMASGRRHSNGYTASAMVEAGQWFDNVMLNVRTGIAASHDSWTRFTDSLGIPQPAMRDTVVQYNIEGSAALWLEPFMPYASVTYTYDIDRAVRETDRDDVTLSAGLTWYGQEVAQGLSFDLSGSVILGRRSQRNFTISAGLRLSF